MIVITADLTLDEREISETFIRASGPGGQNVNKVASAAQLRFDVRQSPSLPIPIRARLERLAGNRLTSEGVIVITAQRFRSQERNREDARERLVALIRRAAEPPKPRRKTRPSLRQREDRLAEKAHRSLVKRRRRAAPDAEP
jgi:ribosome-associated protein